MNTIDWKNLEELRALFLGLRPDRIALADYWNDPRRLESYDRFFAARIGWKWDSVLADLPTALPPANYRLIDWGCGTAIAARRFLARFGIAGIEGVHVWDRSASARRFAQAKLRDEYSIDAREDLPESGQNDVLLISHVINELDREGISHLQSRVRGSALTIWVEPGTPEISAMLVAMREELRPHLRVLAPCPHSGPCGMQSAENDRNWCHFFAKAPAEVFQDPVWARFSKELKIDLRALPVSYCVFQKDGNGLVQDNSRRLIGRARIYKGMAKGLVCDERGVKEATFLKRTDKMVWKELKNAPFRLTY